MQPLQFEPLLKRAIWGGRRLGTELGKAIGDGTDFAESWEIANCGRNQTPVRSGCLAGWPLNRVVREHGPALLGQGRRDEQFPLLVKFLDAHDRLSVQVHPNDEQAQRLNVGPRGKTEAWLILDAGRDGRLYTGLKPGVGRNQFAAHLDAGTVDQCLHQFPIKAGDCVFVPAGTVHAIGAGVLLIEVQQSSDATFRLFDWGRLDPQGQPRPLQIEEAMDCIDFDRGPIQPVVPRLVDGESARVEELVNCDQFELRRRRLAASWAVPGDDRCRIYMPIDGSLAVHSGGETWPIERGDTILIPAAARDVSVVPNGAATVLEVRLP